MSTIFIANTLVVSADMKMCMQSTMDGSHLEISSESDMPCHDQQQNDAQEHCQDACFCPHYAANQAPIIDVDPMSLFVKEDKQVSQPQTLLVSNILSAIYKPPIYLS